MTDVIHTEDVALEKSEPTRIPPKALRWVYASGLLTLLGPGQIVLAPIALAIAAAIVGVSFDTSDQAALLADVTAFSLTAAGLISAIAAVGLAMLVTTVMGLLVPLIASRTFDQQAWLAAYKPRVIKLGYVPLLVIPMLGVTYLLTEWLGTPDITLQEQLFEQPSVALVTAIVVVTIVPFAEEFTFRGALYSALLPDDVVGEYPPQRYIIAFVITTLAFAAVHLLAGFESVSAIAQILLLSTFLTALRTVSGSVWPSVLAHLVWNTVAAAGLIASSMV